MHCCHTVNKRFWNYGKQQRGIKQVYLNAVLNILSVYSMLCIYSCHDGLPTREIRHTRVSAVELLPQLVDGVMKTGQDGRQEKCDIFARQCITRQRRGQDASPMGQLYSSFRVGLYRILALPILHFRSQRIRG